MDIKRRALLLGGSLAALAAAIPRAMAAALGYPRALQGPMVGAPGPDHISVWVRASGEFDIQLEYATDRDFTAPRLGTIARTTAQ